MADAVSFGEPWLAAVVQAAVRPVRDDATARETMRENAERIAGEIDALMERTDPPPRLLVYPVLCLTSASRHLSNVSIDAVAMPVPGEPFEPILEACRRHRCYFVSSAQEAVPELPGRYFHTGFVLGPEGLVLRSPKAQAYSAPEVTALRDIYEEYRAVFGPDSVLPVAETEIGGIGCLVESELLVPEATRRLRRAGAEIVVHPSLERQPAEGPPYTAMRRAVAYANGVYVLSATTAREVRSDDPAGTPWWGARSLVVGPDGRIDASVGARGEGVVVATIDPARLAEARERQARTTEPADVLYRGLYG